MRRSALFAAAALATVLALSGCAAGGGSTSRGADAVAPAGTAPDRDTAQQDRQAPNEQGAGEQGTGEQTSGPPGSGNAAPSQQRSIIYTGDLSLRVDDVERAAARAATLAEGAGGFVAGDRRSSGDDQAEAHLTLRVPADRFIATVDELAKLGDEESRSISAEDVTQQVVDLEAQITSQQASVDRTRALLARAQTIGEIVSIEAELAKRESALATLQARQQRLVDLAALSTVTVHLSSRTGGPAKQSEGFLAGLQAGWDAFLGAVTVLLVVLGFLLPFLAVFSLPAGLLWWLLRRRRRAEGQGAPLAPDPQMPLAGPGASPSP
ncbi:MAG: DUF4349 domain-containing protein [Micromonosporaceae bacterium]